MYTLTSSSIAGVARVGDLSLELRPKIGVAPALFLISYALNPKAWKLEQAQLARDANLAEAVIPLVTPARSCCTGDRRDQSAVVPAGHRRREPRRDQQLTPLGQSTERRPRLAR
jgi:hypothetical protein